MADVSSHPWSAPNFLMKKTLTRKLSASSIFLFSAFSQSEMLLKLNLPTWICSSRQLQRKRARNTGPADIFRHFLSLPAARNILPWDLMIMGPYVPVALMLINCCKKKNWSDVTLQSTVDLETWAHWHRWERGLLGTGRMEIGGRLVSDLTFPTGLFTVTRL